ncbi:MAG: hypothetical protein AAF663_11845 [Planctomycetota bacterium]
MTAQKSLTDDAIPNISEAYLDLIRRHPLQPIRNDTEMKAAEQFMERETYAYEHSEREPEADVRGYFDALAILLEAYYDEHYPMPSLASVGDAPE